jgi:hypothetical protein
MKGIDMKSFLFGAALMALLSNPAFGQAQDTSAVRQNRQEAQKGKPDKFIDRDGDGICDEREAGLGFKRGKHRHERQRGKSQGSQAGKSGTSGAVQPSGAGTGNQYRGGKQ